MVALGAARDAILRADPHRPPSEADWLAASCTIAAAAAAADPAGGAGAGAAAGAADDAAPSEAPLEAFLAQLRSALVQPSEPPPQAAQGWSDAAA